MKTAKRALVVGDATVDITVRSEETPEPATDRPAEITLGPGGQGSNVAVRLARLGWQVRLLTVIGSDAPGTLLAGWLAADGVELLNGGSDRTGLVASLIGTDGERAMASDRSGLSIDALERALTDARASGDDWIHVSGYALADPVSGATLAAAAAELATTHRLSVGGGSFAANGPMPERWRTIRPCLSVFDRREAQALTGGSATTIDLASGLARTVAATVVVTEGAAGATAARPDGTTIQVVPPWRSETVDSTGAGDAFTAMLIHQLADAPDWSSIGVLEQALAGACQSGAAVAGEVGAQARIPMEAGRR